MKPKNQPHQNKVGKPSLQQAIKDAGVYEQLLSVGKKHFLANGVKSLVIRKVVAEANVNLGSFVYYFESKENFIEQVIRSHYEDFLKSFSEQVQPLESKAEPIEKLRFLADSMMRVAREHGHIFTRLILDTLDGEKSIFRAFEKRPPEHLEFFLKVIIECQKSNSIRRDIDPKHVYLLLFTAVGIPQLFGQHLCQHVKSKGSKHLLNSVLDIKSVQQRIDIVLKGLAT